MSAVMMILINVPTTRVPGKGAGVQENLVLTVAVAPPAMTNRVSTVTASGKIRRGARFPSAPGDETPEKADHGGISGKSFIDPEVLRRQRAEETRVYGENACQALFQSRPEAIVRAWFIQSVTPRFKEALRWMAANRKAYHVVDEAELTKASGTEHHGGVCFLIKKRNGTTVQQWVSQAGAQDCVLAWKTNLTRITWVA